MENLHTLLKTKLSLVLHVLKGGFNPPFNTKLKRYLAKETLYREQFLLVAGHSVFFFGNINRIENAGISNI